MRAAGAEGGIVPDLLEVTVRTPLPCRGLFVLGMEDVEVDASKGVMQADAEGGDDDVPADYGCAGCWLLRMAGILVHAEVVTQSLLWPILRRLRLKRGGSVDGRARVPPSTTRRSDIAVENDVAGEGGSASVVCSLS